MIRKVGTQTITDGEIIHEAKVEPYREGRRLKILEPLVDSKEVIAQRNITPNNEQRIDELARMLLYQSVLVLPDMKSKITFRVDGELNDEACDFLIEFFQLVKKFKNYRIASEKT